MMRRIVELMVAIAVLGLAAGGAELSNGRVRFVFDDGTGGLSAIVRVDTGEAVVRTMNHYSVMSKSGDHVSTEASDHAVREPSADGTVRYQCTNDRLPGVAIGKAYWLENGSLRRELTFSDSGNEPRFIILFTDSRFSAGIKEYGYYFGAGYLGPYEPAPSPKGVVRVDQYVQSSKGMVLANRDRQRGSYAHYRVKINNTVVYPWWQSTISSYREGADRLYYLPDGWRMCLGTLDLPRNGGSIRLTDCFSFFRGDILAFFSDVYGRDAEVMADLAAIPQTGCDWVKDVFLVANFGCQNVLKYYSQMLEEGTLISTAHLSGQWGDYRVQNGTYTDTGGFATLPELQEVTWSRKSCGERVKAMSYAITVAAASFSPILKERPDWFRFKNRRGRDDVLFPNLLVNYQTMMNRPGCMEFMAAQLFDFAKDVGLDLIYLDEAQQQNAIDWERMDVMRDDHTVQLWWEMKRRSAAENLPLFFNGSGQPFADINYMEALGQLDSDRWRSFAGVALGLELFSQYRPESRISLIGSDDEQGRCDFCNRIVALGWIPPITVPYDALAMLRAAYEVGKTLPVAADYSPDWKADFSVDVESYCVRRRQGDDVILSFMNRGGARGEARPLSVSVMLDTLGFSKEQQLNVWAVKVRHCRRNHVEYDLSDRERRENFREFGWIDNLLTVPELIYSGAAQGKLTHVFESVMRDDMVQLVAVPGPAGLLAVNGNPQNYLFSGRHGVTLTARGDGGLKVVNGCQTVELLLADQAHWFTAVTLDGSSAEVVPRDIGGTVFQSLCIPKGCHELRWRKVKRGELPNVPKEQGQGKIGVKVAVEAGCVKVDGYPADTLFALVRNGLTAATGRSPLPLPPKHENGAYELRLAGVRCAGIPVTLTGGKGTDVVFESVPDLPKQVILTPVGKDVASGVRLLRSGTHRSYSTPPRVYQENLPPCVVSAEGDLLRLHAGNTRREDSYDSRHYAGFEFSGVRQVRLKYENTFYGAVCNWGAGHHVWGGGNPKLDFVGFVVDYRVKGHYAYRVAFSTGIFNLKMANGCPEWGTRRAPDRHVSLGDLINKSSSTAFSLDLAAFAPEGWDGTVFFSVGATHVLSSRGQTVTLLEFNNGKAGDFIRVYDPAMPSMVERKSPGVLAIPRLKASGQGMPEGASGGAVVASPSRAGVVSSPSRAGGVASPSRAGGVASPSRAGGVASPSRAGGVASASRAGGVASPSRAGGRRVRQR